MTQKYASSGFSFRNNTCRTNSLLVFIFKVDNKKHLEYSQLYHLTVCFNYKFQYSVHLYVTTTVNDSEKMIDELHEKCQQKHLI